MGSGATHVWLRGPGRAEIRARHGPSSPVGNFSLIDVAELHFAYILQLVERFDADRREAAKATIWNSGGKIWYLDRNGLPTVRPWTFDRFRRELSEPRLDDCELR